MRNYAQQFLLGPTLKGARAHSMREPDGDQVGPSIAE